MREKDQETQVDIIAEMRMGSPVGPCAYRIGLPDKEEVYESGAKRRITMIKAVTVQELADRFEAAAKREKAQPGNAAAMREALGDVYNTLEKIQSFIPHLSDVSLMRKVRSMVCHAKKVIDTALSAPPRQYDVGTPQEQEARWDDYCDDVTREECPPNVGCKSCALYWAQMPYAAKEGAGE